MSSPLRFFKCNILNGCRLADIERFVKREEYFYLNSHIACTSRSVNAALNAKWIIEVTEKEASRHITIPMVVPEMKKQDNKFESAPTTERDENLNNPAYQRYQERLARLAATKTESTEPQQEELHLEPGKNDQENLGALQRIKNRNNKVKSARAQEKGFIDEVVEIEREGRKNASAVSRQVDENRTTPKVEQVVKRSKEEMKKALEKKLASKIESKKTVQIIPEEPIEMMETIAKVKLEKVVKEKPVKTRKQKEVVNG